MRITHQQHAREEEAWREIGHTSVRPSAAWAISLCFLAAIFAAPFHQHAVEWLAARRAGLPFRPQSLELIRRVPRALAPVREEGLRPAAVVEANRVFLREINLFEDNLEDASLLGQYIRPAMQAWFSGWPGVGNEKAYVGRGGWLFYRPAFDYLTGPGFLEPRRLARRIATGEEWQPAPRPDPRPAIIDFHRQLKERGIDLIVMPVPVKLSIHPEKFTARYAGRESGRVLQNVSYGKFLSDLAAAGVNVFDPSDILAARRPEPQFLAADTHWRPESMEAAAGALAEMVAGKLGPGPGGERGGDLRRRPVEISGRGDIALMLDLPDDQTRFPPETVTVQQVLTGDGQFWRPEESAAVLVLGDSFSNIFSLEAMGWGESAGLVEQLAYFLDAPLDRLARNDQGAWATREMLARELARGRDRLAGKRVVVWQFAARELAVGDWRIIPLELRDPPEPRFVAVEAGQTLTVTGTVREIAPVPRPGTVPYRDHVTALRLVGLPDEAEALVYLLSMRDNEWTRAARLRPGEEITVRLRPWDEVADRYDGINRSELDDFELQLQEHSWGELVD